MDMQTIRDKISEEIQEVNRKKEEEILKELPLKWYKAHSQPKPEDFRVIRNCIRVIDTYYGFIDGYEPLYEDIRLFDLRHVYTCTIDELFDKHI